MIPIQWLFCESINGFTLDILELKSPSLIEYLWFWCLFFKFEGLSHNVSINQMPFSHKIMFHLKELYNNACQTHKNGHCNIQKNPS
jgi:hypothetical protein